MIYRGNAHDLFSIFAKKRLANVGPNGDPMATPSICWNDLSLYKSIPVAAIRKSFTKVPLSQESTFGFSEKIVSAIYRIMSFSGTLVNKEEN